MRNLNSTLNGFLCFVAGAILSPTVVLALQDAADSGWISLNRFSSLYTTLENEYVDPINHENAIQNAIDGLLDGLDKYTTYIRSHDLARIQNFAAGEIFAYGFTVNCNDGIVQIASVEPGSPADRAKFQTNDIIQAINGITVDQKNFLPTIQNVNDNQEYGLNITIVDSNGNKRHHNLIADEVVLGNVKKTHYQNATIIEMNRFTERTVPALKNALYDQSTRDATILIIDLRGNAGGLVNAAIEAADLFLENGVIVSMIRRSDDVTIYEASPQTAYHDDLIILVDEKTASAAEIFAAALKDNKRATVLGATTFGKASIQKTFPIRSTPDAIRITTHRYRTPSGDDIQNIGIKPDKTWRTYTIDQVLRWYAANHTD